jgi:uracil-DNA glycosylase family 4
LPSRPDSLRKIAADIVTCTRCPRLREHCAAVSQTKRRAYLHWDYWGKPVPGFGDAGARLIIIGLAPGAHGANRTGRIFTGDRSGDFLYRALYETGFASQPVSQSQDDGLQLIDAYITGAARCAPPDNKPTPEEFRNCRIFLGRELALLKTAQVVVALGKLGFDAYLAIQKEIGAIDSRAPFVFGHEAEYSIGRVRLIGCYHPSQQNTSTGRLTAEMLRDVFDHARALLEQNEMLPLRQHQR